MGNEHEHHGEHISPLPLYFGVYGALLVLTVLTVLVSLADLGAAAIYAAMAVAMVKATLVATFFMHLKWDDKFNVFVFTSALLFMSIFFIVTALDLGFRGAVNPETDTFVLRDEQAAIAAEEARKNAAAAEAAAAETAGTSAKLVVPGQPE
jgi:cytochrome c oxidase subunit 4